MASAVSSAVGVAERGKVKRGNPSISPDGTGIAYLAPHRGRRQVSVREIDNDHADAFGPGALVVEVAVARVAGVVITANAGVADRGLRVVLCISCRGPGVWPPTRPRSTPRPLPTRWCSALGTTPSWTGTTVLRAFRRVVDAAGLDSDAWTSRELRHSFVSLLPQSGVRIEDISRLVGHSGTAVTERVYRHELRPVLQEGAAAMDALFRERPQA